MILAICQGFCVCIATTTTYTDGDNHERATLDAHSPRRYILRQNQDNGTSRRRIRNHPMMVREAMETQESRSERVTIIVTEAEKQAVRAVAAARGLTESDVMRDMTVAQVLAEYGRIRAALGIEPAA